VRELSLKKILLFLFILSCFSCKQNSQYLILEDGSYFNGSVFVPFKEIQIKDGKIVAITNQKSDLPGKRISVANKYIIPGLIDAHVHMGGCPAYPYVRADPILNAHSSLRCGVTTNIDLFYPETEVKSFEDTTSASPEKYSSMLMSGPLLTAPGGHGTEYGVPTRTISSVAEAEKITNEVAAKKKIDVIKLCYQEYTNIHSLNEPMVKAIVEVAHKYHKKVFAHIDDARGAMDCLDAGVDVLAHMPMDSMSDADLDKLKKSGVPVIPTITVMQSLFEGHTAAYMSDSLLWQTAQPDYLINFERKALPKIPGIDQYLKFVPAYMLNLRNCIKMHIPLIAGTDAGNYAVFYGYSLHNEMAVYCQDGMSAADALCSATQNIQLLFPDMLIGKIATGYTADMVILNANPLDNIENTRQIDFVLHQGYLAQKAFTDK
jgi:imidazolonepropionase-like amidohydrolase